MQVGHTSCAQKKVHDSACAVSTPSLPHDAAASSSSLIRDLCIRADSTIMKVHDRSSCGLKRLLRRCKYQSSRMLQVQVSNLSNSAQRAFHKTSAVFALAVNKSPGLNQYLPSSRLLEAHSHRRQTSPLPTHHNTTSITSFLVSIHLRMSLSHPTFRPIRDRKLRRHAWQTLCMHQHFEQNLNPQHVHLETSNSKRKYTTRCGRL
jgi:hypothetical protein